MKGNTNRGVAQLASASGLGPEGPVFESQYPDKAEAEMLPLFFIYPNSMMQTISGNDGCFEFSVSPAQSKLREPFRTQQKDRPTSKTLKNCRTVP